MDALPRGQIRFLVHSAESAPDGLVSASVFATKLATLVRALRAADKSQNGTATYDYKIKKLHSSDPTAILIETPLPPSAMPPEKRWREVSANSGFVSGVDAFTNCADAVVVGDAKRAMRFGRTAALVGTLAQGANKSFGYGEVWTYRDKPLRVDPFLNEQSRSVIESIRKPEPSSSEQWFKGVASGSFDGTILEVDLRGALPECKLVLSAGKQEIDCVCRAEDIEDIRSALNHRVQLFGRAIYDGKSGLPRRIEVDRMEPITGQGNLARWKGAFEPFEPSSWESDD